MRGRFITFEGGEGCGKSTQIRLLAAKLSERGIEVVETREPGGTLLNERIRHLIKDQREEAPVDKCELLLFLAARAQLVEKVVLPALERGAWVLSDRFCDSTFAYQGYGRGLDMSSVKAANGFACGGLMPDLTFLLEVDAAEAEARRKAREQALGEAADRIEQAGDGFHARIRRGFDELAAAEPARIRRIDAGGTREETAERIWKSIAHLL